MRNSRARGRPRAAGAGTLAREGKLAIFHHGIGWGWIGMIRYMELFRAEGWTVVAYDSRGHGVARKARPSYGYFEKDDLRTVVDWALARFGCARTAEPRVGFAPGRIAEGEGGNHGAEPGPRFADGRIAEGEGGEDLGAEPGAGRPFLAVFGESMGAATVLQYAPLDPRVDAVVADCPFSSAKDELDYQLKKAMVPPGLRRLVSFAADAFCRRLEGFSLREADAARAILRTEVPILFVHGLEDRYVPWSMSVAMAERRRRALPEAVTELLLVPGARHGASERVDRFRYAEALRDFLEKARGGA